MGTRMTPAATVNASPTPGSQENSSEGWPQR